jgi:alpha-glucosidase
MIAPMVEAGTKRSVLFPKGKWISNNGISYSDGKSYSIEVPLERIPYFNLIEKKQIN